MTFHSGFQQRTSNILLPRRSLKRRKNSLGYAPTTCRWHNPHALQFRPSIVQHKCTGADRSAAAVSGNK